MRFDNFDRPEIYITLNLNYPADCELIALIMDYLDRRIVAADGERKDWCERDKRSFEHALNDAKGSLYCVPGPVEREEYMPVDDRNDDDYVEDYY